MKALLKVLYDIIAYYKLYTKAWVCLLLWNQKLSWVRGLKWTFWRSVLMYNRSCEPIFTSLKTGMLTLSILAEDYHFFGASSAYRFTNLPLFDQSPFSQSVRVVHTFWELVTVCHQLHYSWLSKHMLCNVLLAFCQNRHNRSSTCSFASHLSKEVVRNKYVKKVELM